MNYTAKRTLKLISRNSRNFCIEKVHVKKFDLIGPADPVSNLRPIIRTRSPNEMGMQKKLTDYQDFVQNWNQEFWTKHNLNFIKRKSFAEQRDLLNNPNSDEMSEFYKKFLDDNWKTHLSYNYQWYKHNLKLLLLSYATIFEKMLQTLSKNLSYPIIKNVGMTDNSTESVNELQCFVFKSKKFSREILSSEPEKRLKVSEDRIKRLERHNNVYRKRLSDISQLIDGVSEYLEAMDLKSILDVPPSDISLTSSIDQSPATTTKQT